MDRSGTYQASDQPAMRSGQFAQIELLLFADQSGKPGKHGFDESDRSALSEAAVLWFSEDDLVAEEAGTYGQSQARGAADEGDGVAGDSARAPYQSASSATSDLSISASRSEYCCSERRMVRGHYLRADSKRSSVSYGCNGLVQQVCFGLGTVELVGYGFLSSSSWPSVGDGQARNFQYGSRIPVYERGIHRKAGDGRYSDQHGRTRQGHGQSVRRTIVADGEIRRHLSSRLCRRIRNVAWPRPVFPALQYRPAASGACLSDSERGLFEHELNGGAPAPLSPRGAGKRTRTERRLTGKT